jgi:hypothetical protein
MQLSDFTLDSLLAATNRFSLRFTTTNSNLTIDLGHLKVAVSVKLEELAESLEIILQALKPLKSQQVASPTAISNADCLHPIALKTKRKKSHRKRQEPRLYLNSSFPGRNFYQNSKVHRRYVLQLLPTDDAISPAFRRSLLPRPTPYVIRQIVPQGEDAMV